MRTYSLGGAGLNQFFKSLHHVKTLKKNQKKKTPVNARVIYKKKHIWDYFWGQIIQVIYIIQYHDVTILKCMKHINEKHSTQKN